MPVLKLAVPTPLRTLFDYLPPEGPETQALRPGVRVRVPFGRREMTAYLAALDDSSELDPGSLKRAATVLDEEPLIAPGVVALCGWAAKYYQHPPGEVFQAAFPKALRDGKPHRANTTAGWELTTRGKGLPAGALARSPKQSEALRLLQETHQVSSMRLREAGLGSNILRALEAKGLAARCEIPAAATVAVVNAPLAPGAEQAAVLAAIAGRGDGYQCHLVEGVTGSGKTEVYLQCIAACLARGRQALVLIPEIGLTPQTLARFSERFDAEIVVLHSGLSDAERYRAWEAARSGTAHIVIGTRSAVFTSLARPGLIVVDEEHDQSYKQQDGFRYSARDLSVKRAQLEDCPVILGSATPSLETLHNALQGRYVHHRMRQRAGSGELPTLEAVDIRKAPLQAGLSPRLVEEIEHCLRQEQQVLLFLNRRGYAPTLQCHDCGWVAECSQCDARLTLHRRQSRLRCHHCGAAQALLTRCPTCRSDQLLSLGLGTEQAEDWLRERFAKWPMYRVDSDSMRGRAAMQALVDQINKGGPCILLGTQMLTKGHHFPGVSLVGIIDMDSMLFSTDFRGEERAAQLLTQVAGRAGREQVPGRLLLQTHYPEHPLVAAMLTQSYHQQALAMLERRRDAALPPSGYLLIARTDCTDAQAGEHFLRQLREATEHGLAAGASFIGPLPAPMQRRAGRFRSQLLVHTRKRHMAREAAHALARVANSLPAGKKLSWSLDVDPQDVF